MMFERTELSAFRAVFALVCMLALVAACSVFPASAWAADKGEYRVEIPTSVAMPSEETVISVVVPSVVSVVVQTSIVDGTFIGFKAGEASIENGVQSSVPVRISLTEVQDRMVGGKSLLDYVDMELVGDHRLALTEGSDKNDVLFSSIAPGKTKKLGVELANKDTDQIIPAGGYQVKATMKVTATLNAS